VKLWGIEEAPLDLGVTFKGRESGVVGLSGGDVLSVAFSRSGRFALSGGFPSLWKVKVPPGPVNDNLVAMLEGYQGPVLSVVFSSDDFLAVPGSLDATVKLWDCSKL
jgi:WD40 repeat protein